MYEDLGDLPEIDELMESFNLGEAPGDDADAKDLAAYTRQVKILTWYVDQYVPMAVGVDWWGPEIRPFKLMTDTTELEGKQKVLVTVTSEAFGLLQYENSRSRWINVFKWKKKNGKKGKKAPQYNRKKPETEIYKAMWSDFKSGQCSGWNPVAFQVFEERKAQIKAFRDKDKENGYAMMKRWQGLIKAANDIDKDSTGPSSGKKKSAPVVQEHAVVEQQYEITIEDE